jgi:hypothetical protein
MSLPTRVCLDTNIYLVGAVDESSPEAQILRWLGFEGAAGGAEVVVSEALFNQILRVSRRLHDKDWAGSLLYRIWRGMTLFYAQFDSADVSAIEAAGQIPREDIEIYLTARAGLAQVFISANHELVRALAARRGEFDSCRPDEFVQRYLADPE